MFLDAPDTGTVTSTPTVTFKGSISPGSTLTIGGQAVAVAADGTFSVDIALKSGVNSLAVVATNAAGLTNPELVVVVSYTPTSGGAGTTAVPTGTTSPTAAGPVARNDTIPTQASQPELRISTNDLLKNDTPAGVKVVGVDSRSAKGGSVSLGSCGSDQCVRYQPPFALYWDRFGRDVAKGGEAKYWRVIVEDFVTLDTGTGIVHTAPGCGAEDFELGKAEGLPVVVPVDDAGHFYPAFGELAGQAAHDVPQAIVDHLAAHGALLRDEPYHHRYPVCWRCQTELIFRVVDEWFISAEGVREPMIEAARTVRWVPEHYGKRMEDWLRNMGDWCISRKRYWGLPLPFYRAPSGKVTVVGSLAELRERAVDPAAVDALPELHRPWIDDIEIRTDDGEIARRVTEVGDCWLDAGIVPFSTLGWERDAFVAGGYAQGAGEGLTVADLPDHAYWERWFPADWVSEMREQIRLWFYSQLFMSVVLVGKAPYRAVLGYEKLHDETGRAMHKSWGNAIWFDDAVEKMGADVMRWLYAAQTPSQNMNFGYGPANEVKRRLLTLWNSYAFLVRYADVDGFRPTWDDLETGPPVATALDAVPSQVSRFGARHSLTLELARSDSMASSRNRRTT